jgi:hypothetical protein
VAILHDVERLQWFRFKNPTFTRLLLDLLDAKAIEELENESKRFTILSLNYTKLQVSQAIFHLSLANADIKETVFHLIQKMRSLVFFKRATNMILNAEGSEV